MVRTAEQKQQRAKAEKNSRDKMAALYQTLKGLTGNEDRPLSIVDIVKKTTEEIKRLRKEKQDKEEQYMLPLFPADLPELNIPEDVLGRAEVVVFSGLKKFESESTSPSSLSSGDDTLSASK